MEIITDNNYRSFIEDLKDKVKQSRYKATLSVNRELILLYHHIGKQILNSQKIYGWGAKIIDQMSQDLRITFPEMKGFSSRNLKYMRKFADEYQEQQIVQEVLAQLTWYHNTTLLDKVSDKEEREFYIKEAITNGWSRNMLVHNIESDLYVRSKEKISNYDLVLPPKHSDLAKSFLKDPHVFEFIDECKSERDLEKSLVAQIQKFMLELGRGFAFVGSQYQISVGDEDFFIDLLFYHIKLKSYVIIELKTGKFKPEYAGKLQFYITAVDRQLREDGDNPSIGIILCKDKNKVVAEYSLEGMKTPLGIADYKLKESLPSTKELEEKLNALPSINSTEE